MALNPVNLIDKYINTSYDVVKKVYDNLAAVVSAGNIVDTNQVAASNPTTRADGSPLQTGDTYFNTNENVRYIYNEVGPIWVIESNFDDAVLAAANAATSESNAATSETNAATSETNAGLAKVAAELAETNAETAEANVTADLAVFISGIGANVASAAALPLLNDGDQFTVTGAITITSMNTLAVGKVIFLTFATSLTLTHHATNLILPGATNILTASNDIAVFQEYALGDWRLLNYIEADFPIIKGQYLFPTPSNLSTNPRALDDYQEGSWTPFISDSSELDTEGQTYNSRAGRFVKIGKVVFITGYMNVSSFGTLTMAESGRVGGLPFTSSNVSGPAYHIGISSMGNTGFLTVGIPIRLALSANDTVMVFIELNDLSGTSQIPLTQLTTATSLQITFSGFYFTDE